MTVVDASIDDLPLSTMQKLRGARRQMAIDFPHAGLRPAVQMLYAHNAHTSRWTFVADLLVACCGVDVSQNRDAHLSPDASQRPAIEQVLGTCWSLDVFCVGLTLSKQVCLWRLPCSQKPASILAYVKER